MRVTAIHQFIPTLALHDAIGAHSLQLQSLVQEMGIASRLFVENVVPQLADRTTHYTLYRGGPGQVLLYQASTGSAMADFLLARAEPLLMSYHNITPSKMLDHWEPAISAELDDARSQLARLAPRTSHAIADSAFNQAELCELGYRSTSVSPPMIDPAALSMTPDAATADWLSHWRRTRGAVLLFVGRIIPNKAQHDVVRAFALYRRVYDSGARLCLVGGVSSPRYHAALKAQVADLGLSDVVDITGSVSGPELVAYYEQSDVFVCLSDHEGFCVPVVEAMHHRLPVVGFDAGAVGETMGEAGLRIQSKSPALVATAVNRVVRDVRLRQSLVSAGAERAASLSLGAGRVSYRSAVEKALSLL